MSYDLPNPFFFLSHTAAGSAAPVENPTPSPSAGAASGYPCCEDCGYTEQPCDEHCPNFVEDRFELDASAFLSDIEPVPAFLTRPVATDSRAIEIEELLELARAEEWPAPPRRMVG